ncbi:mRNA 3'-end-processing protein rna14 [Steccherinum ochraceum]|uniref:mRNA 3'-end-processing protein RNA14 n=1 Tax=Steccherinum ochraceum TaxID=92696 RepID=A0A4R0RLD0_9APHY|nr:mRNA 3'-end-processing protein rna14 [Steccherinum ochraceum]
MLSESNPAPQSAVASTSSHAASARVGGDESVQNTDANDKTPPLEDDNEDLARTSQDTDLYDLPGLSPQASQDQEPACTTPQSRLSALQARTRERPNDASCWIELISHVKTLEDHDKTSESYDALLQVFPNTPSVQLAYLNDVLESSNTGKNKAVAQLFNRFLKTSPFVELWKYYLAHVRKLNPNTAARSTVRSAYEFALNYVGHDQDSDEIWRDYIQFLKAGEAPTTFDESQKMDAIRKAYQRAIQTPMASVQKLWDEYSDFEKKLNPQLAKKFLSDHQPSMMKAQKAYNALHAHTASIFPVSSADGQHIVLPMPPTFTSGEKQLMTKWRQYLKWEESNPLEFSDKERARLHARVQAAYRKAVVRMRYYPEIWYMAYVWASSVSNDATLSEAKRKEKREEAVSYLKGGIAANTASFVLNFAYAELLEEAQDFKEVHNVYQKFIGVLASELNDVANATDSGSSSQILAANTSQSSANTSQSTSQSVPPSSADTSLSSQSQYSEAGASPENRELKNRQTEYSLVWSMYMRFARRAESQRAARDVFAKARKDKWVSWEVYEAAALMEYHCTKTTETSMRIFERALEKFPTEEELAVRYLGFLISINDDSNARALFEKVITKFSPERAKTIWDRWARYEYQYGTLQAAKELEKRIAEAYPNDPPIKRFADRHKYLNIDTIAVRDLGFRFNRGPSTSQPSTQNQSQSQSQPSSQEVPSTNNSQDTSSSQRSHASALTKRPSAVLESGRESPAKRHKAGVGGASEDRKFTQTI